MKHIDRFSNDELHLIARLTKTGTYECFDSAYGKTGQVEVLAVSCVKEHGYVNEPLPGFTEVTILRENGKFEGNVELHNVATSHMHSGIEHAVLMEMGFIDGHGNMVKDAVVKFLGDVNRAGTMRRAIKELGADKAYRQLSAMGYNTEGFFELVKKA